jgi:hypothetical protein
MHYKNIFLDDQTPIDYRFKNIFLVIYNNPFLLLK